MADNEIVLLDYGDQKLSLVKLLKSTLGIGIAEAKEIIDKIVERPQTISLYGADANEFASALKELGVAFEHKRKGESSKINMTVDYVETNLIPDLMKRIEALEERIAKLEQTSTSAPESASASAMLRGVVVRANFPSFDFSNGLLYNSSTVALSDGRRGYLSSITTSEGNYTVGQTRKIADMFGYKYDSKTKREALGWELVSKYGDGKWAFIGTKAVNDNGVTYDFIETDKLYSPEALSFASNKKKDLWDSLFTNNYMGAPFSVNPSWSEEQIHENLVKFIKGLVRK